MENNNKSSRQNMSGEAKGKNTGMAVIAYILFFVPLLTKSKNDPFVKFHVKQGLVLFVSGVIASIISSILPLRFLGTILNLAVLVLFVLGIINALTGKEKMLPVIGKFASKVNF